jgi:predicted Zn-dependent protease with MMP-like domain
MSSDSTMNNPPHASDRRAFEELVSEALDSLPDDIAAMLSNVEVVVEDEPPAEYVATLPHGHTLLGHYHGIPLTNRGRYDGALPDKISIYRGPIVRSVRGVPERIKAQVRKTVLHEIGHHFGIEEHRLHELGYG